MRKETRDKEAVKTATKTTQKTTPAPTTATCYKVTPKTAKLLDCIRTTDELYCMIVAAMAAVHDETRCDETAAPYLEHVSAITDMLHNEIIGQLCDNLGDVENCKKDEILI